MMATTLARWRITWAIEICNRQRERLRLDGLGDVVEGLANKQSHRRGCGKRSATYLGIPPSKAVNNLEEELAIPIRNGVLR
jgi:hypothetical protein